MVEKSKQIRKLSQGEMEIMSLLWEHGPMVLSDAHASLGRPLGYTTVQTRLNRLVEKGLARRSKERPARYEAAISASDVSANHLEILLNRVTGGKVVPLVAHLVDDRSLTHDELSALKKIINEAEQRISAEEDLP